MSSNRAPRTEMPPRHCPACGDDLSEHPYYQRIPSPPARGLIRIAKFMIPVMIVVFVALFATGAWPLSLSGVSGWAMLAFVLSPSALLYAMAQAFPPDYRVVCLRCSWFRDYAFRLGELTAAETPLEGDSRIRDPST